MFAIRPPLQQHDDQMSRVSLRGLGERIGRDNLSPFPIIPNEEVGHEAKLSPRSLFKQALEPWSFVCLRTKHKVPTLQNRSDVIVPKTGEHVAKIDHAHLIVSPQIDGPEEGDVGLQRVSRSAM